MRIIGGLHKGYRFQPPKKTPARPTTDIAKEGLFNVIYNSFDFEDVKFLDLFGGTGSISYEMASRGCEQIILVELASINTRFIEQVVNKLELPIQIVKADVFKFVKRENRQFDVIFAGPPYAMPKLDSLPDLIFEHGLLAHDGWFVLEHNPNHNFEQHANFYTHKNYGSTIFSIFKNIQNES